MKSDRAIVTELSPNPDRRHVLHGPELLLPLLAALIAVLVVFGQALANDYAYDGAMLVDRARTQPLGALSSLWIPEEYGSATAIMSWRPISAFLLLAVDVHLFRANPALSHALNLLFHVLNGWLLFLILHRWEVRQRWPASPFIPAVSAGLFLLHPLVTEVVLCAGFRMDQGALTALLLGLWLMEGGILDRWGSLRGGLAVGACLLLGLGFKEVAYMGLLIFPAYVLLRDGRDGVRRAVAVLVVCGSVAGVFVLAWTRFKYEDYTREFLGGEGRLTGVANFSVALVEVYLRKLLLPWPLRIEYGFEPVSSLGSSRFLTAAAILSAMACGIMLIVRRHVLVTFGLAWVFLGFLPVSQVVPVPEAIAERFAYVPLAGLSFVVAGVLGKWFPASERGRRVLGVAVLVVAMGYALLSFRRSLDWRDNITLNIANWEQPRDERPRALESLGGLYLMRASQAAQAGDGEAVRDAYANARESLEKLVRVDPQNPQGYRLLAVLFLAQRDERTAALHARKALRLAPVDPQVRAVAEAVGVL